MGMLKKELVSFLFLALVAASLQEKTSNLQQVANGRDKKSNKLSENFGSGKLRLQMLHLRILHLRHLIFGKLNLLRKISPLEILPSGCYIIWIFHLREISPSRDFIFGKLLLRKLHLWSFNFQTL